jgi:hypothetical protein
MLARGNHVLNEMFKAARAEAHIVILVNAGALPQNDSVNKK